jgi:hypothetical protein
MRAGHILLSFPPNQFKMMYSSSSFNSMQSGCASTELSWKKNSDAEQPTGRSQP